MRCEKRRFGRLLSLILAIAMLMNMTVSAAAEQMSQTEQAGQTNETEQTGQAEQTAKYRMGKLRVQFEDYTDMEILTVLC